MNGLRALKALKYVLLSDDFPAIQEVQDLGPFLGCEELLLHAVEAMKPRVHIFGHIHGGDGFANNQTTQFVNAAYLNEAYRPIAPAGQIRVIEL